MANLSIYIYDEPISVAQTLTESATPGQLNASLTDRVHVKDTVVNTRETLVIALTEGLHVVEAPAVAPPVSGTATMVRTRKSVRVETLTIAWTSDTNGTVSGHPFAIGAGALWQVEFIPNLGATQPSNSYNVFAYDSFGVDLAIGKGATLTNAAGVLASGAPLAYVPGGTIDIQITAAGNAKTGTVVLTIGRL